MTLGDKHDNIKRTCKSKKIDKNAVSDINFND